MGFREKLLEGFGKAIAIEKSGDGVKKKRVVLGIEGGVGVGVHVLLRKKNNLARP